MKSFRMNRLFNAKTNRCFDVAIDHGVFNQVNLLKGIENMQKAVKLVADAAPDAIQLTPGQAHYLQSLPGKEKPALVLRIDTANVYGRELPRALSAPILEDGVKQAVRLDAACIVLNLFQIPNEPEVTNQCIGNILRVKAATEEFAMPLMIEPLVFRPNAEAGGYMVDGDEKKIIPLVRQAVELGADIIKADPTDDTSLYHKVVEIAGTIPVLVRGGGKVPDQEILTRTYELVQQGAAGIVYGRNVIHHAKPKAMTKALMAVLHSGVGVKDALEIIKAG